MRAAEPLCYRGINLSGAEYGEKGGTIGKDYIYPSEATIAYFAAKGMNSIRLPIKWERLQPLLNQRLDADEMDRLRASVLSIRRAGLTVILDPHNYGYYDKQQIGSPAVPNSAFADFWARLAVEFAGQPDIVFGLMNEPYDVTAPAWLEASNQAIAAIRAVKANNLILVPGTIWTGAHSWEKDIAGGSNATVMLGIRDSGNNFAYEFHQYLDSNYSGTHSACDRNEDARQALVKVSAWLRKNGKRGYLGEFGGSKQQACITGLSALTETVAEDSDVWIGWAYWAAGEWWPEDEALNIQPRKGQDRPQLAALLPALQAGPADPSRCRAP